MSAEEIKRAKPRPKIVRLLALLPVGTVVTRPRCPRLGSLAVRTFRLVTLAAVAIAVAACAIQPTDLSPINVGATRATVEGVLGKPVKSMQTDSGRIDTYKYNMGYTPTGGSGGGCPTKPNDLYCALGGLMIGAVLAPIVHGIRYGRQRGDIEVTYGPQDTVVRVETTWVRQRREEAEKRQAELVSQAKQGDVQAQISLYRDSPLIGDYKRALVILEKALGPEHPQVAPSLNGLATVYRAEGKYAEAEPLFKRALAIVERSQGSNHPHVAFVLNDLALLYSDLGKYSDAEALYQRAVAIRKKALGANHPDLATSLENYAALLRKTTGRSNEATRMEARAKAIRARHAERNPAN